MHEPDYEDPQTYEDEADALIELYFLDPQSSTYETRPYYLPGAVLRRGAGAVERAVRKEEYLRRAGLLDRLLFWRVQDWGRDGIVTTVEIFPSQETHIEIGPIQLTVYMKSPDWPTSIAVRADTNMERKWLDMPVFLEDQRVAFWVSDCPYVFDEGSQGFIPGRLPPLPGDQGEHLGAVLNPEEDLGF
jgi:hypothetical protein